MTDEAKFRVERYLAGIMPGEEKARFLAELERDPKALAYLGRCLRQQAILFGLHRQETIPLPSRSRRWPRILPHLVASAALLMIASLGGWWFLVYHSTVPIVARLESATGTVSVVPTEGGVATAARTGQVLASGARLQTVGAGSKAVILYSDGSRMETHGPTEVRLSQSAEGGKWISLTQGEVVGQVTKQMPGRPMILDTALAEARVLGTHFLLATAAETTRLVVDEGLVELKRKVDGLAVKVTAGEQVVCRTAGQLAARPHRTTMGLHALYLFDEGSGTIAHDRVGNPPADIALPEQPVPQWAPGGLRVDVLPSTGQLFPPAIQARLEAAGSGTVELWLATGADKPHLYTFTHPPSSGGSGSYYIDGTLAETVNVPADITAASTGFYLWLAKQPGIDRGGQIAIHQAAVYNRALTPSEVKQNADAGSD